MGAIVIVALFALVANPIISLILVKATKPRPNWRKKLVRVSAGILALVTMALFTNVSTSSGTTDWAFLGLFHLAICVLLWLGASLNDKPVSILSIVSMVIMFGSGYLSSISFLLVVSESEPSRSIRINNSTLYREYNRGFAFTSWGGSEVTLFTSFRGFPFIEREFFSKQYISDLDKTDDYKSERFTTPENSRINTTPSFYGTDFKLTYDTTKNELILSYGSKRDTLYLDR